MTDAADPRDLVLTRHIKGAPELVYRCWTEPELMKQWFCPRPWTTPVIETDVRPGGSNYILMRGPEGEEMPNRGVYLEVVPGRRLVTTDAFTDAWTPSEKPFLTIVLTFEPEGDGCRYTARARHWTVEDKAQHEAMGFEVGWGICADQLEEVVAGLKG
jgi:uncharacterized protein YndB with AHSA1/START domain